jgi:phospholipid/cholesterol/gamma-HCH transport system substrate-binding protein
MRRLAGALLVALLLLPACSIGGKKEQYQLTAHFPRAVSLFPSGRVRVLGLPAGSVKSVETKGDEVEVVLSVDKDIPVPADVRAAIVPQSLIGERYVQLFPAWKEGEKRAKDGQVIPRDRAVIPVEPDEALAALKEFLETLDPDGIGRLIDNAAGTLKGNGRHLNDALDSLSQLVQTFAEKDDVIVRIMENFDEFTSTLRTREQQLGHVMDAFATAAGVLASERRSLEGLIKGLSDLSTDALDLVSVHSTRLRRDVEVLTRTTQSIDTNIDAVGDLLDSGELLVKGLKDSYNPDLHAIDLRNSLSPAVERELGPLTDRLGGGPECIPVDVKCEPQSGAGAEGGKDVSGQGKGGFTPASFDRPHRAAGPIPDGSSWAERVGSAASAASSFLGRAAGGLLGLGA